MAGGGMTVAAGAVEVGYLTGCKLIYPLSLIISLFFLWGFGYGFLDILNKHFQTVLGVTEFQSAGLQVVYFGGGYLLFSPVAAEMLKHKGFRVTILMGLEFYSIDAVMFWPTAHVSTKGNETASFGGFSACTLIIAWGIAILGKTANSYAVVIGDHNSASARLQFCQSWNGVAVGILISLFFVEAPMYPTIFTLGTANLGRHTRRGVGILAIGFWGGAIFPPMQGTIADAAGTKISYGCAYGLCGCVGVYPDALHPSWVCGVQAKERYCGCAGSGPLGGAVGGVTETVHDDADKMQSEQVGTVEDKRGSVSVTVF